MNGLNNMSRALGHMTHLAVLQSGDRRVAGKKPLRLSSDRTWGERERDEFITDLKTHLLRV